MQEKENITVLINQLDKIISTCNVLENKFSGEIYSTHPAFRKSVRNLLHYLGLRNHDIRQMQEALAGLGLSSLGRSEGYVKNSLIRVRNNLARIYGIEEAGEDMDSISIFQSRQMLYSNTEALLGGKRDGRNVRIMVTLSGEMADRYDMIRELMKAGMDCARINCAHDDQNTWIKIIDGINRAKKETGLSCKILMDLAGLKLRTGSISPGPRVIRIKARRDFMGKLIGPARIWLGTPSSHKPDGTDIKIPVDESWIKQVEPGDKVGFQDSRGKKRQFEIVSCEKDGCQAELFKRSYLETGTTLFIKDKKKIILHAR